MQMMALSVGRRKISLSLICLKKFWRDGVTYVTLLSINVGIKLILGLSTIYGFNVHSHPDVPHRKTFFPKFSEDKTEPDAWYVVMLSLSGDLEGNYSSSETRMERSLALRTPDIAISLFASFNMLYPSSSYRIAGC